MISTRGGGGAGRAGPRDPGCRGERPEVVLEDDAEAAAQAVRDGEFDGLLTVSRGSDGELAFEYLGSASPTNETRLPVTQAAQRTSPSRIG